MLDARINDMDADDVSVTSDMFEDDNDNGSEGMVMDNC